MQRDSPSHPDQSFPDPASAAEVVKLPPSGIKLTELGNAERLVARHGEDLRYCHPWRRWYVWDGRRWQPDATAEVLRRAKETVRAMYGEAAKEDRENRRGALATWALYQRVNGVFSLSPVAIQGRSVASSPLAGSLKRRRGYTVLRCTPRIWDH